MAILMLALVAAFGAVAAQLVRLGLEGQAQARIAVTAPISESYSRPVLVDRDGRVLAMDILLPSVFADPSRILDLDEAVEKLSSVLPEGTARRLRGLLSNPQRRFVWISRKVSTALAERIHNLGLPGVSFRWETKRTYPAGTVAGHVIGAVDIGNRGIAGLERHVDLMLGLRMARTDAADGRRDVRLSLSLAAQHAAEDVLREAMTTYGAEAASALVMNVNSGEIAAAASLPGVDPAFPGEWVAKGPINHASGGVFELGSIFKLVTVAAALDRGDVKADTDVGARPDLKFGRFTIGDVTRLPKRIPLSDVIVRSSNVASANLALMSGAKAQRAMLSRMGLIGSMRTEAGPVAQPRAPEFWNDLATATVSYGHGIAVAPIQFAAAAAALVNGGFRVKPTFLAGGGIPEPVRARVISQTTSDHLRAMMRANVRDPRGTGRLAAVAGYDVGGKTGTADQPNGTKGYDGKRVVTSFVGAFPMQAPKFLVMVVLHDPKPTD
ncbi:MAG: penicillin-binding protein 2, partial [Pseudomonadota bacterium]